MGIYDIQGKNCLFQLKIGDDYFTVVCAKSFTFNPVTDMKETTTVGSGFWKEFRPRKLSYTITFNGMVQVASLVTQEKIKTFFDYQIQFLPLPYRMLYYDNSGNVMNVNGTVYVTSNLFDASPANLVNGTTELQGTGPLENLDFVPEFINVTVSVTGDADAKTRFILYTSDGTIAYDTSTLLALLPTGGWLVQGESVVMSVQKGQYAWGVSTDDVGSETNTFDLNITPAAHIDFTSADLNQNSLPTAYDFLTDKTAVFDIGIAAPPPTCVPPAIPGSPALPDGATSVPYSYSFPISGSVPFNITNVTKPSWLGITTNVISGTTYVQLSGTPDTAGTGIVVSFDINNACGTVSFSDTINITETGGLSRVDWSYSETPLAASGLFRIYVNSLLFLEAPASDSGFFNVIPGSVVEVQVLGSPITEATLEVDDSVSGNLFNSTAEPPLSYAWISVSGHDYTIAASLST